MASASRSSSVRSVSGERRRLRAKTRRMRSIAQKRLTAVGRVAAKVRHRRAKWRPKSPRSVRAPSAIPMAAATPTAGAPRITMSLMARATSRWSL